MFEEDNIFNYNNNGNQFSKIYKKANIQIFFFILSIILGFSLTFYFYDQKNELSISFPKVFENELIQTKLDYKLSGTINKYRNYQMPKLLLNLYYGKWKDKLSINDKSLSSIEISEEQYANINNLVFVASKALGIKKPKIFLIMSDEPNAYVTNVTNPTLVIHSELLNILDSKELLFVIGHELAHIKFNHVLTKELSNLILWATEEYTPDMVKGLFSSTFLVSLLKWERESEISADRVGTLLVGSSKIANNTLAKFLSGLNHNVGGRINIEALKKQRISFNETNIIYKLPSFIKEALSTHPFVISRMIAIDEYESSDSYKKLFSQPTKKIIFTLNNILLD